MTYGLIAICPYVSGVGLRAWNGRVKSEFLLLRNAEVLLGPRGNRCQRPFPPLVTRHPLHTKHLATPLGQFPSDAYCKYRASWGLGKHPPAFGDCRPMNFGSRFHVAGKTMARFKKASIRGTAPFEDHSARAIQARSASLRQISRSDADQWRGRLFPVWRV